MNENQNTAAQRLTHGSLFSGIGGFDLASEWMGWDNVFHCEWNEFGQKILNHYWPKAISYDDITKTDFTVHREKIDILTGGFPCQPYSHAGKRLGKEDDRHLWPAMLRAIREIQPAFVVGENVSGLLSWNAGLVFEEVQTDLENEGYQVQPVLLPAAAVGAPHRRDRIWFIAYHNDRNGKSIRFQARREKYMDGTITGKVITHSPRKYSERMQSKQPQTSQSKSRKLGRNNRVDSDVPANPDRIGRNQTKRLGDGKPNEFNKISSPGDWSTFPTQSPICSGNDGISDRLDGITFPKWRNESIKGYGNAIVPQVAHQIFKALIKSTS